MPRETGPPARLRRWTGFLLAWVAASGAEHYGRALLSAGLKTHHLGVLVLLQDGPMVQSRLSEHLGVFKPVMVSLINDLEAMALVRRVPHPTDRRAVEVHLLPAGRNRIRTAEKVSRSATDEFFAPLTQAERRVFHELLAKLADRPPAPE
ncbi:MarR family winged helix-turn-helix transcriptional regulator [Amycolatopsis vastitatis]|uniref:MarR family transcriptional regulator n=1 Tax=Amycolatopsis vastitatis TaxID=1905142 RepID=A0A229SQ56_9PSEU|nr:MarR family winged helix-turn-helix transcriptional regulator [Amycolatopsis vastitatis]OXM60910.1 MarR family transcriptional regulator [Amycolatopsis vastitatis]